MSIKVSARKFLLSHKFWLAVVVGGCIVQLLLNILFVSTWNDEGYYAYMGYVVTKGIFPMYSYGGPWLPYMPLVYLIPGYLQTWFGPSLWIGRIFSTVCAVALIPLLYYLTFRLCGPHAAKFSIALLVGSIITLRYYATGVPLVWGALFIAASFGCLVSPIKSPWREILAVALAVLAFGFRQNLIFVFVFITLFSVLEQRRWVDRIIVLIASPLFTTLLVLPFWPGIMQRVFVTLPIGGSSLAQIMGYPSVINEGFGSGWRLELAWGGIWSITLANLGSVVLAIMGGGQILWTFYSKRTTALNIRRNRILILLAVTSIVNFLIHLVGNQQACAGCVYAYYQYFAPLAIVLGASAVKFSLQQTATSSRLALLFKWFLLVFIFVAAAPLGLLISHTSQSTEVLSRYSFSYAAFLLIYLLTLLLGLFMLSLRTERFETFSIYQDVFKGLNWQLGMYLLGSLIGGLAIITIASRWAPGQTQLFRSAIVGLVIWIWVFLVGTRLVYSLNTLKPLPRFWWLAGYMVGLTGGLLLFINTAISLPWDLGNVMQFPSAETAGLRLKELIAEDEKVFSTLDTHPLLYAERYPFPPLITNAITLVISPDDDNALYFNRWTYRLAEKWLSEADIVLTSDARESRFKQYYVGYSGSGADVLALIRQRLDRDFMWVADIPNRTEGIIHVYRRRDDSSANNLPPRIHK